MIWIINANSNICRIYNFQKSKSLLTLLKEINHPESRLKAEELLTSDRPGHYQTSYGAHGAYSPHMEAKEVEIDHFAREIASEINEGRNKQLYDKLIVIAAPKMSGLLFKHIDKHAKEMVINDIQKDLIHLTETELLDF